MTTLNTQIAAVTRRIEERSAQTRDSYLAQIAEALDLGPRHNLPGCGNIAHVVDGQHGAGRGHFSKLRGMASGAETGASIVS